MRRLPPVTVLVFALVSFVACADDEPVDLGGAGGSNGSDAASGGGGTGAVAGSAGGGAAGTGGVAGTDASVDSTPDVTSDAPEDVEQFDAYPVDGSACGAVIANHPIDDSTHVDVCSKVTYSSNPPASGHHYPIWASYTTYTEPVPRGFWVHNLEHGGVVLLYNCPSGCATDLAAAEAFIAQLPVDPICSDSGGPVRRIVLTPDPLLDVKWAASAWGWTLKADCFEAGVFGGFVSAHYAHAPEDACEDGVLIGDGGFVPPSYCGDGGVADAATD